MSNEFKAPNGLDVASQKIINLADGSGPADAVNKSQLDNAVAGLAWKQAVRAATTATGTLATAYANGQSIDGVTLATGDRILIKNQSSGGENGIYVVAASGAPARATDADTAAEVKNATVLVSEGTVNAGLAYTQTVDTAITLGTTALVFAAVGGGTTYTAGNGLTGSSTFSVLPNGSSIDVSASGVKIAPAAAGNGLTESSGVLAVNTGSGLEVSGDAVRIATGAAGTGLTGGGGSALSVDASVVVKKYTALLGAVTGGSPVTVTHGLGNKSVMCVVYVESTGEQVLVPPFLVDTTSLTLTFNASQSASYYRVVVQG